MKRLGTVLVFSPTVTKEQAEAAVKRLQEEGLIQKTLTTPSFGRPGTSFYRPAQEVDVTPRIESFHEEHGMPVFYVP